MALLCQSRQCCRIEEHPLAEAVVFLGGEPTDQLDFLQRSL